MDQSGPNRSQMGHNASVKAIQGQERVIPFKSCLPMPWELVDAMSRRWRSIGPRPSANERNPQPCLQLSSVLTAEVSANQNRSNMVLIQSIVSTELSDPRRAAREYIPRSSRRDYADSRREPRDSRREDEEYYRRRKYQRYGEYFHRKEREARRDLRDARRDVRDPRRPCQSSSQRQEEQNPRISGSAREPKIQGHSYYNRRDSIPSSPKMRLGSGSEQHRSQGSDTERTGEHYLEDYSYSRRKLIGPRTPPGTPPSSSSDNSPSP